MSEIIKDLGDGLILRRATVEDAGKLADHNADLLCDIGMDEPDEGVAIWTRDLMERGKQKVLAILEGKGG